MTTEYTEPAGLSDEELLELMPQQFRGDLATVSRMAAHGAGPDVGAGLFRVSLNTGALNFARAVEAVTLARVQRLPGPEQPTRRHLMMLAADMGMASVDDAAEYARAVLARWVRPAPQPPADGEVQELVSSLRSQRANYLEKLQRLERYEKALSAVMPPDFKDWWENSKDEWPDVAAGVITNLRKREELAWEQVERLRHPQPVPLSERPWEREGWCDEQGRCWALNEHLPAWEFHDCADSRKWADLFLPAHALPLPGEVEHG